VCVAIETSYSSEGIYLVYDERGESRVSCTIVSCNYWRGEELYYRFYDDLVSENRKRRFGVWKAENPLFSPKKATCGNCKISESEYQ